MIRRFKFSPGWCLNVSGPGVRFSRTREVIAFFSDDVWAVEEVQRSGEYQLDRSDRRRCRFSMTNQWMAAAARQSQCISTTIHLCESTARLLYRQLLRLSAVSLARLFFSQYSDKRYWLSYSRACIPADVVIVGICQLSNADLRSLDFTFNRLFMKLFKTNSIDVVKACQSFTGSEVPSCVLKRKTDKFILRLENTFCNFCSSI